MVIIVTSAHAIFLLPSSLMLKENSCCRCCCDRVKAEVSVRLEARQSLYSLLAWK